MERTTIIAAVPQFLGYLVPSRALDVICCRVEDAAVKRVDTQQAPRWREHALISGGGAVWAGVCDGRPPTVFGSGGTGENEAAQLWNTPHPFFQAILNGGKAQYARRREV
jgi:hypothetical protein